MLLSAFDQAKAGITTDEGGNFKTWNNKVSIGSDATFYNYVGSDAANSVLWKMRSGKGVGYDLTAAQQGTSGRTNGMNAYLYLGNGIVNVAGNYSVEYSTIWMGTSEDGVQTAGTANLSSHNEKFGAWGTTIFGSFSNYFCFAYNANGLNGDYGNDTQIFRSLIWQGGAKVQTVSNVMTINAAKTSAHRDIYANATKDGGTTQASGHAWMTGSIPGQNTAVKTPITTFTEFWYAQNMANTTYAVRVYNRDLTPAEIKQNTVVDVLAYHGADVSAVADFSEFVMDAVFANCDISKFAYSASAQDVQNAFDAAVASAILIPSAEGYQKGTNGTSLRLWMSVNEAVLVDSNNVTALGVDIAVTGDAEKSLSGSTERVYKTIKNGEEIVCEAEEGEYLYAAIVEGIPQDSSFTFTVTPYALVNGEKVYGEAVTFEWPAVE